jgi:nitroreductase
VTDRNDLVAPETLRKILDSGALAPSGDNLQPWIVEWRGDHLQLSVDRSRDRSLYNFRYRASLIALGAMVENMAIAALEEGLAASIDVPAAPEGELPAAVLTFSPATTKGDPLYAPMARRCTNRKPYRASGIEAHVLQTLQDAVPAGMGADLRFIQDRAKMRLVAEAASLNDRLLYDLRPLHDQFYETIRWTEREAEASRDGLFIRTLELGPMAAGFKAMRSWRLVSVLNRLGWGRFAPGHSFRTFMRSGAFGFLRMDGTSQKAFIDGGRVLERIWLTATSLGLAFQPMAGSLYLRSYLAPGATVVLSVSHREVLVRVTELFGQALPPDDGKAAVMLFRVGYGPQPSARSLRRSIRSPA